MSHAWFFIPVKILLSPTPKTSLSGFGIWPSVLVSTLLDANMTDFGSSLLIPAWTFSLPDMIPEWLCSSLNVNVQLLRCMETSFITSRIGTYENWTLRQARTRLSCSCGVETGVRFTTCLTIRQKMPWSFVLGLPIWKIPFMIFIKSPKIQIHKTRMHLKVKLKFQKLENNSSNWSVISI